MSASNLTHIDEQGAAHMVDVSQKHVTSRQAVAEGFVAMDAATRSAVLEGNIAKGDVLATARLAGIMAAKKTSELIPLCHPLLISKVAVDIEPESGGFAVRATVRVSGQTGVEMEALTAVSVACLTIYDMAKALDKSMQIGPIQLLEKQGGKSGHWQRPSASSDASR